MQNTGTNTTQKALFWTGDIDDYYLGHQAEEILKARIYAPFLETKKDTTVIDLGANIGMFSLYASKYAKQVYSLEPSKDHFKNFTDMLAFNQITNVKPINKAIFTRNEKLPFFHNPNKTMYSLHQAVSDGSYEEVEAITLEKLFEDEGIEHVDLLKADIEGSEIELFSHPTFKKVSGKIDVIVTERHSWSGRASHQLDEALKNNGFRVGGIPNDADIVVAERIK